MRRRIYHILLTIPLVLVLLHSVTPHHHLSPNEGVSIIANHPCSESLLSQIFQVDLGKNHLEDFQTSRCDVDLSSIDLAVFIALNFDLLRLAEEVRQPRFIPEAIGFKSLYLKASRSLRAPPVA